MNKVYYSGYMDFYLDHCKQLIAKKLMTKEEAATRLSLPSFAATDLFENTYNFSLTEKQINHLIKESDKIYFHLTYSKEEQHEIIDSYDKLKEKKSLTNKELIWFKDSEGKLDRAGYFEGAKKKIKKININKSKL